MRRDGAGAKGAELLPEMKGAEGSLRARRLGGILPQRQSVAGVQR